MTIACILLIAGMGVEPAAPDWKLEQLPYHHPGLVVDLGVGLWAQPLPMDWDGDGHYDLLVATADIPSKGVYFFKNPGNDPKFPVFKPGVRLCTAVHNMTVSYIGDTPVIMTPGTSHPLFREQFLAPAAAEKLSYEPAFYCEGRARQWKRFDYNGNGIADIVIGASDWREYGWDNAYNEKGEWTNGPIRGHVYVVPVSLEMGQVAYGEAIQIQAGDKPLDVFGAPSPNFADWDGDGDLDIICGEFLDTLTYFENIGIRSEPRYAEGRRLQVDGADLTMDLQMLQVIAIDWTRNGNTDLIVGQEDGRVALIESTGEVRDGLPVFLPPRFFQQEAEYLKVGALSTPFSVDWDGDGDEDLIVGDTAGYISFVENLDGGDPPKWAPPRYLEADREVIRIQAGPNGSIQGPAEAKWGYTVLSVADWNHNGLLDIVVNSIWGAVLWYENAGEPGAPRLKAAQPIEVAWEGATPKPRWVWWQPAGRQLVTQWRTTPVVIDLNEDGLNDLVMLDTEGYLAFFERRRNAEGGLELLPGQRIFQDADGQALRLNDREAGKSGRRKLALADWDGDGRLDILINGKNIDFLRNIAEEPGAFRFKDMGMVDTRILAGHTTSPAIVDWNRDGIPDLLIGAEDGFFYYMKNPRTAVL